MQRYFFPGKLSVCLTGIRETILPAGKLAFTALIDLSMVYLDVGLLRALKLDSAISEEPVVARILEDIGMRVN